MFLHGVDVSDFPSFLLGSICEGLILPGALSRRCCAVHSWGAMRSDNQAQGNE